MIEDDLQRLHGALLGAYQALSEWRDVLPVGTSIDTAFALGEVLVVLAKASELVSRDIDQGAA